MDKKKIFLVSLGHLSCDINGGAVPASLPYLRSIYGFDYQAAGGLVLAYSCLPIACKSPGSFRSA